MINFILILAIAVVFFLSLKSCIGHFRGEGSCCGGREKRKTQKKLDSPILERKTVLVDGMKCRGCEEKIRNELNKIEGLAVKKAEAKKGRILFEASHHLSTAEIKDAVERVGFTFIDVF